MSEHLQSDLRGERILAHNLRLLADEGALYAARGQAMAAEAARMLSEPFVRADDRFAQLSRECAAFLGTEGLPPLTAEERVAFVRELLATFGESGAALTAAELLPMRGDIPERISYFRTVYTDEAYDGFSADMREPTVQYADAFFLSCEDVKNGEAGYCILPCENSDGPLPAMTALADRYGLFRTGTYRAFHADGENATHFGLFAMAVPAMPRESALVLRFSAIAEDAGELALHLAALSQLGLSLLRTDVGAPDEEGTLPFTASCLIEQGVLVGALVYLRIFAKRLVLRGLYEEIG